MSDLAYQLARRFVALSPTQREQFIAQLDAKGWNFQQLPLVPFPADETAPLTLAQRRLWFLWKMAPASHAYNLAGALRWRGALQRGALEQAFAQLLDRHSSLRTRFVATADGGAEQHIDTQREIALRFDTATGFDSAYKRAEHHAQQAFDLEREPLLRFGLIRIDTDDHLLWLVAHHIVVDGWSMQLLLDELLNAYRAIMAGEPRTPPRDAPSYRDYACWQRYALSPQELERQLAYWKRLHAGSIEPLRLPTDRPRPTVQALRGARHKFFIDADTAAKIREHARARGVTLFVWLLTAYRILLYRLSAQADLRIGIASAGRHRRETENLVGFFVGTQVLHLPVTGAQTFDALLQSTRDAADGAQAHPDLPFDRLVEALAPARDLSRNPLFQAKFTQQIALPTHIALPAADIELLALPDAATHFDLGLDITDRGDTIEALFTYDSDLFAAASVAQWGEQFRAIAGFFAARPQARVAEWSMLKIDFDHGEKMPLPWSSVLDAWHMRLAENPQAPALHCEDESGWSAQWTRAAIDTAANRLAQTLIGRGIRPGDRVAICSARSAALVIGILAAWKTGAAYVPLDSRQPRERLQWVIDDARAALVVVDAEGEAVFENSTIARLHFEQSEQRCSPLPKTPAGESPAYLIYTSGSTGRPKGVVVSHTALAHYTAGLLHRLAAATEASFAMVSTVAADLGHTTLFGALADGRALHLIAAARAFDPDRFAAYMAEHRVGVLKIVPSHLQGLLSAAQPAAVLPWHALIVGGETTSSALLQRIRELAPQCRIVNHYGPSETTVGVLADEARAGDTALALGMPLPNVDAWLLDADLNPVPVGVVGELYLGGPQLALGYAGKPALTAERFVPHPFARGARLYRSGDTAKRLADGRIVYLGRRDDQIKIRGYRVEPREIVAQFLAQPNVQTAEVSLREIDGRAQLLAWVTPAALDTAALKAALGKALPDYMVPAHILPLAALPLTANGKIDRAALPLPDRVIHTSIDAPRTDAERILLTVWQAVLDRNDIGIDDNFFELGGDSILSLQVIVRARKHGLRLTPKQLFEQQTIAALAAVAVPIDKKPGAAPAAAATVFPLTPIQRYFFDLAIPNRNHWNQSLLLAPRETLTVERLQAALAAVVERHPALRTRFEWRDSFEIGAALQQQVGDFSPRVAFEKVNDAGAMLAACEAAQRCLDIKRGHLLAALLAEFPDGRQRLLLCIHHLAIDGVSWRIVLEDLSAAYREPRQPLPAPSSSFDRWSQQLQQLAGEAALRDELDYWRNAVGDERIATPAAIATARHHSFSLTPDATTKLQTDARVIYGTRGDELLIAAFVHAWSRTFGAAQLQRIWLESHGRDLDAFDASRCVGWFTSVYPVALRAESDVVSTVAAVQKTLRAVPRSGIGFGVLRYLGGAAALRDAVPAVVFNHLGRFDNSFGADALFDIAGEAAGSERDPGGPLAAPLLLVSRELGGALQFDWTYDANRFSKAQIENLAQRYVAVLHELIEGAAAQAVFAARDIGGDMTYPASPMQQGLLFHAQLAPASTAYINQLCVTFTDLDSERFIAAWRRACERHEILRTAFDVGGDAPQQRVYRHIELPLRALDWRGATDQAVRLSQLAAAEIDAGFAFDRAPLMRLVLVRLNECDTRFIWTRHHLLLDGWSTARLLQEIADDYAGHAVAPPRLRYRDHIDWLMQRDTRAESDFWRTQLRDLGQPTLLGDTGAGGARKEGGGYGLHALTLDAAQTRQLADFARARRVTLNTLLQGAWALLLGRYCGQRSVCFGVTVSGRPAELDGIDSVLGLFINTLPLICDLAPNVPVAEFLPAVQARNAAMREFEQMPLGEIQQLGGGELFDTLLVFENFPLAGNSQIIDSAGTGSHVPHASPRALRYRDVTVDEATHYALTLVIEPGRELALRFSHDRSRIDIAAVRRIAAHLQALLKAMTLDASAAIGNLSLPAPPHAWNDTDREWGAPVPLHEAIRRQALHSPQAIALTMAQRALSYAQLDAAAEGWARRLRSEGVGSESIVAIAAERSFELVIGLLAILKTGAAYLPIDPDYPAARIAYMLDDARPALLLTQRALRGRFAATLPVLNLDEDIPDVSSAASIPLHTPIHRDQLAYVIYTSGSTGRPKAAGNTHGALFNRLQWMQAAYPIGAGNCVLQKTPIGFDVSVWEFFWPLITGATLALAAPGAHRDPQALIDTICAQRVDTLHFVPSMLQALLLHPDVERCDSVRRIICSGEALPAATQNEVLQRLPHVRLYNLYGPTEAAIDVTHWSCVAGSEAVPIGVPIANTQIHILDADLNPLPTGVAGELYIGGVNLARGYRARAGLTAERFVPNPFRAGERLYRSGDLARRREDGTIDYLGRLDQQIKLRGQRIEPGEIEAALRAYAGVRDAAVIAHAAAGGQQLAGYVVADADLAIADLRAELQRTLPDYMVPATLTRLAALPLSPNGKLDRGALPAPEATTQPWQPPQGEFEVLIAAHWQRLLGCERVGRDDQFFMLGGHSLLAAQLVARLRAETGFAVPLQQLFDTPVLADFARAVAALQAGALSGDKIDALADLLGELEV